MNNLINKRLKRQHRVRSKLLNVSSLPRLVVTRSNKNIFAQLIDNKGGKVICSFGSNKLKGFKGTKTEAAIKVGEELAEKIKAAKITNVVLDRGHYMFHGRIKALAESIKKLGVNI